MDSTSSPDILITGGTGKVGRRLATGLSQAGHQVRIGSRTGEPPFAWDDPATWPAALSGISSVFVAYAPDISFPGAGDVLSSFGAAARHAGARKLVLLSGRGLEGAASAEAALRQVAPATTVLRCSWFNQNFSESFLAEPVNNGAIVLPTGPTPEPFIDAADIAAVAVKALTEDGHDATTYELTGGDLLTFSEVASILSTATGHDISFASVSVTAYVDGAVAQGAIDRAEAAAFAELFAALTDGRNATTTDDLPRLLGRPARSFSEYATAAARAGAWGQR